MTTMFINTDKIGMNNLKQTDRRSLLVTWTEVGVILVEEVFLLFAMDYILCVFLACCFFFLVVMVALLNINTLFRFTIIILSH